MVPFVVVTLLWPYAHKVKDWSIVDIVWPLIFPFSLFLHGLLANSFFFNDLNKLDNLFGLVIFSLWGFRLSTHLLLRAKRLHHEDKRFSILRKKWGKSHALKSLVYIFWGQAFFAILLLPLALTPIWSPGPAFNPNHYGMHILRVLILTVFILGWVIESVADYQLIKFKKEKHTKGVLLKAGLWSWVRHPNYLGEVVIWISFFLWACLYEWGWLTIYAPILMMLTIFKFSGIKITEKLMDAKAHDQLEKYKKEAPGIIPHGLPFKKNKSILLRLIGSLLLIAVVYLTILVKFKPVDINLFYEKVMLQSMIDDPETSTELGIPVIAELYDHELTDVSPEQLRQEVQTAKLNQKILSSYNSKYFTAQDHLNRKIFHYYLQDIIESEPFVFHEYFLNQMFGIHTDLPDLMIRAQKIDSVDHIKSYLTRMEKFELKFNQVKDILDHQTKFKILPPKFVFKKITAQIHEFLTENMREHALFLDFTKKITKLGTLSPSEIEQYQDKAEKILKTKVYPSYQLLLDTLAEQEKLAGTDDGVWHLPYGEEYYKYILAHHTTTDKSPEEIHQIGLGEIARIENEMIAILKAGGYYMPEESIGGNLTALSKKDEFLFDNSDKGREDILAEYTRILGEINKLVPQYFNLKPKANLKVKRVPIYKQDGAAGAYYFPPAMDGSRGGTFYANLKNVRDTVKFGMKTLAVHEGIPGHHFQIALSMETKGIPTFRKFSLFTAFVEGWALYSENLALGMGLYQGDALGNLGRLQAEMFRAVRLVVDTGLHAKKWTREEAIDFMFAKTGMAIADVTSEIERYIVMPGQACAYKIGMLGIQKNRNMAESKLGPKFDIRKFHDFVLANGAVPLAVLDELTQDFIRQEKKI